MCCYFSIAGHIIWNVGHIRTQAVTKPAFWKNTTSALLWNGNKNRNLMITCGWLKPRSVLLTESCIILLWSNILGRNEEKEETQISFSNWLPNFSLNSCIQMGYNFQKSVTFIKWCLRLAPIGTTSSAIISLPIFNKTEDQMWFGV